VRCCFHAYKSVAPLKLFCQQQYAVV